MRNPKKPALFITALLILLTAIIIGLPTYLRLALIYQHPGIDDYPLFDNRTVKAATSPIEWPLHKQYNQIPLSAQSTDSLVKYQSTAFLVLKNDSLLYESYWDGRDQETISNSFSTAKSIIAFLIGIAIDEGKIQSVHQKVIDILPWIKGEYAQSVTIEHLLTMSSGSSWDESYSSATSITTQAYYGKDLLQIMRKVQFTKEPGKRFEYRSGDTQFLAMILHQATGKSVSEYASEKLWQPLGATNDALWSLDQADGIEKAYCCFNSTARDFARIGTLALHKGNFNGRQIISEAFTTKALSPAIELIDEKGLQVDYYGYQWWIAQVDNHSIPFTRGILGQYIFILPHYNAVVVRLGHKRSDARLRNHPTDVYAFIQAAIEMLEKTK